MSKRYRKNFRNDLLAYIEQLPGNVVLRQDVKYLGEARQLTRGLNALIEDGILIRLGYGIYAKAAENELVDFPILTVSFSEVCIEALERLGIEWELSDAVKKYNSGESTQVPVHVIIRLKTRFRGKISDGRRTLLYEKNKNAC